ncbi:flagellar biosynthetic protein FliR [Arthrobacter sp. H20]|uniref:flagellar biosynthetic protein FliR n=1 Tax=Arthrobacter sp. H20 TaxID=1267981 RepID=UPI00047BBBCA|nr:flagellar biosynthetic protein FliR [Arthrobacter sp. H20]
MEVVLDQGRIEATMLAGVRMIAFLVIAPPFSYNAIPARIKAMLAIGLALAVSPQVADRYESPGTAGYITALILELLVGAMLGFLVLVVFSAIQAAGSLIDLFGGFSLAQGFDPQSMVNGAQFTRLFQMTALALLFASDGYQLIIAGLARTFSALPIGGGIDLSSPVEAITGSVTNMFLAAVQIAGPLIVILFLADVGLGLLTRVAPALNAFALGFPLKILVTLLLAATLFVALPRIVSTLVDNAVRLVMGVG